MPEEVENAEQIMELLKEDIIHTCPSAAGWLWEFWNELKTRTDKGC